LPQQLARPLHLYLAPPADLSDLPRFDSVALAFSIAGDKREPKPQGSIGGLWLGGDVEEGLARLRWIAGSDNAQLVSADSKGKVTIDTRRLTAATRTETSPPYGRALIIANHIAGNEGLLLLLQLTSSRFSYLLHIGDKAPTRGSLVAVGGSLNLDNRFDSRINPYRRGGEKLAGERPPARYDSLVAMNPVARWFNLASNRLVPVAHITFHELVEAYAKLEMGLDYLGDDVTLGAHEVALLREARLKLQRPSEEVVLTRGSNRVLRTEEEARHFFAKSPISAR
jgi:hypothetical protein